MKRFRQALLLFLLPVFCVAQDANEGYEIEGHFDRFTTDEMGNVYALQGDELRLFDPRGRSWLRNSVKTFGRIGNIDAFYSLKPMLFAPEQGQIAVLDNTLSLQGSVINLSREGYPQVVMACASVQNSFWFFDQRDMALVRVDAQLRPLAHSGRLDQVLGFTPAPASMQEHDSRLYVNDPQHGVLVFDLFATYMHTLDIRGAQSVQVRGGSVLFADSTGVYLSDLRSAQIDTVSMTEPMTNVRDLRVERGFTYLLLEDRIMVRPLRGTDR